VAVAAFAFFLVTISATNFKAVLFDFVRPGQVEAAIL